MIRSVRAQRRRLTGFDGGVGFAISPVLLSDSDSTESWWQPFDLATPDRGLDVGRKPVQKFVLWRLNQGPKRRQGRKDTEALPRLFRRLSPFLMLKAGSFRLTAVIKNSSPTKKLWLSMTRRAISATASTIGAIGRTTRWFRPLVRGNKTSWQAARPAGHPRRQK